MTLKISISGIRGILDESLTDDVVVDFASAFVSWLYKNWTGKSAAADSLGESTRRALLVGSDSKPGGEPPPRKASAPWPSTAPQEPSAAPSSRPLIIIGRDSRASGEAIQERVTQVLTGFGCDVIDIGICPTPTVQLAVRDNKAAGGIVITASHNPIQWNGLKFISAAGIFLKPAEAEELIKIYESKKFTAPHGAGTATHNSHAIAHHIESILAVIPPAAIGGRKLRVAVDSCNGAGSVAAVELLRALGCEVFPLYTDTSKAFPRGTEPVPENLTDLCKFVVENKCVAGFAQDPDADRLALVDEEGRPLGEERTLVLAADYVLAKETKEIWTDEAAETPRPELTVVVNLSTSMAIEDVAKKYGARVIRTPVGEVNVSEKMKETDATIGGEGNGGVIYPQIGYGRDSLTGMALICAALSETDQPISKLNAAISNYVMAKGKIECHSTAEAQMIIGKVRQQFAGHKFDERDGLKIIFDDGWLHVRASNTEPIVRLMAEAPDVYTASERIEKARLDLVKKF